MNSGTMTHEGAVMGTLDYIAPEQARNAHLADTRADLYSLGCTLYYLLTAQPVFPGGTSTEKLLKHQFQPPPSVHALRPDVPAPLVAVLQRLLAKQPEQRFQTPAETAAALSAVLSGAAVPAGQRAATAAPGDAPPSEDGMFRPPETPREEMADTAGGWSSIIEAPAVGSSASFRRRRAEQRQHLVMWSVIGSLTLLALITLLLMLL